MDYVEETFDRGKRAAQWEKLAVIAATLATGRDVLWVDADSFPTLGAPNPAILACRGDVLLCPIDQPGPMPMLGIALFRGRRAADLLHAAHTHAYLRGQPFPEQRAIGIALGLRPKGHCFHPLRGAAMHDLHWPVHPLAYTWVTTPHTHLTAESRVLVWHAAVAPNEKPRLIAAWLQQERHLHPAAHPIGARWAQDGRHRDPPAR